MTRMGMDVDAVEQTARQLQRSGDDVQRLMGDVDRLVSSLTSVWEGSDARRFVHEWWPQHRRDLSAVAEAVRGLGQSAWNNAQEQREASGGTGGPGSGGDGPTPRTGYVPPPQFVHGAPTVPREHSLPVQPDGAMGSLTPRFNDWAGGAVGRGIDYDKEFGFQCADVVMDYAEGLFPGVSARVSVGGGNANEMFGNASSEYFTKIPFGSAHYEPRPGDVICIGPTPGTGAGEEYGHVAVIEKVENGVIHVIEQDGNHNTQPARRGTIGSYYDGKIQGLLRPIPQG